MKKDFPSVQQNYKVGIPSVQQLILCGGQPRIFTTKNSRWPPAHCQLRSQHGEREEGCRLAKWEQPQWVRDCRQEVAISERGKGDGRVAMREQLQRGQDCGQELAISRPGKRQPAGEEGAAPARARTWTGMGHLWPRKQRYRLAKRDGPQRVHGRGQKVATSGQRGEGCRLAKKGQPQTVHGCGREWAISERGKRDSGWR